jgi:hypothetical protein
MAWTVCQKLWNACGRVLPAHRRPGRPAPFRFRPSLEVLEGRTLPSTIVWINPAGGDWDTPANWSGGKLPGATDDVSIDLPGITVTHAAAVVDSIHSLVSHDALVLSGGSLTVAAPSTLTSALTITGGTFAGPGTVTVTGLFTWAGGTLSGGSLTADGGLVISNPGSAALNDFTLTNAGPATMTGTGALAVGNGSVWDNLPGATLGIQGDLGFRFTGPADFAFNNGGTVVKSAGAGEAVLGPEVNNAGTVQVLSGTLVVGRGTNSGAFLGAAGTTLIFASDGGGTAIFTPTSSISGDRVIFQGGGVGATFDVFAAYNVTGASGAVADAAVHLLGTVRSAGSVFTLSGGTITLPALAHGGPQGAFPAVPGAGVNLVDFIRTLSFPTTNSPILSTVSVSLDRFTPLPPEVYPGGTLSRRSLAPEFSDGNALVNHLLVHDAAAFDVRDPIDTDLAQLPGGVLRFFVTGEDKEVAFPFSVAWEDRSSTDTDATALLITPLPGITPSPEETAGRPAPDLEDSVRIGTRPAEHLVPGKGSPVATLGTDEAEEEGRALPSQADPDEEFPLANCLIGLEAPCPSRHFAGDEHPSVGKQNPAAIEGGWHEVVGGLALLLAGRFALGVRAPDGRKDTAGRPEAATDSRHPHWAGS